MHRTLVVTLILVLGFLVPLGAPVRSIAQDATPEASPPAGDGIAGTFDTGERELYLECTGAGSPTVVFDAGQGGPGDDMIPLRQELAKDHLACTYDRANTGRSGPAPSPRTAAEVVADLHALLAAARVPGPYVLVGQSAAGVFVQLYARTHPEQVVGVVAMNAVPPATGPADFSPRLTAPERIEEEAYYRGEGGDEPFDWFTSFEQLNAAPPPPNVPFAVLISTIAQCESPTDICGRTYADYEAVMQEVAAEWPGGSFSQVEAGHQTWFGGFDETVAVIRAVVDAAG